MAKKILSTLTFGAVGALLGDKKKKATAPIAEPGPKIMPLADGDEVMRARRKAILRQRGNKGRTSTMLTSDSSTLGGGY